MRDLYDFQRPQVYELDLPTRCSLSTCRSKMGVGFKALIDDQVTGEPGNEAYYCCEEHFGRALKDM